MASALDPGNDSGNDSDGDYGYDLSLEDETILLALASGTATESSRVLLSEEALQNHNRPVRERDLHGFPPLAAPRSTLKDDIESAFGTGLSMTDFEIVREEAELNVAGLDPGFAYSHAPSLLRGGPRGKAPVVGVARSDSVQHFAEKTEPRSTPTAIPTEDVSYPDLSNALSQLDREPDLVAPPKTSNPQLETTTHPEHRSPLLRFRSFPKKPLSVTDLTAGAWCELQYEYTLTRLPGGKRTRTPAMKGGTKVHQRLEDEVHTTVRVEVTSREDVFGLKVWNIIQGLRTLRDTGLTRELEVWGLVDGNVVNGLIDGLSYHNPDPNFEEEYLSSQETQDPDQHKITSFFQGPIDPGGPKKPANPPSRKIYLVDVKTRATKTLPSGAALRPTKVQLFLYHQFLSEMAANKLDYLRVFRRYGLDPDSPFSDEFIAQIGSLHDEIFYDATSPEPTSPNSTGTRSSSHPPPVGVPDLVRFRSLRELVDLLRIEIQLTFPAGADSIGTVMTVEYRARPRWNKAENGEVDITEDGGEVIGQYVVPMDSKILNKYLNTYLKWWSGERAALGVPIEEAYKCRMCEFAEDCTWRRDLDEENLRKAREKLAGRDADSTTQQDASSKRSRRKTKR